MSLIDKLQQKPEIYRKRVALMASLFVTLLLIMVWASVQDVGINNVAQNTKDEIKASSGASPFSTFGDDLSRIRSGFTDIVNSIGSVEYSAEEVVR